MKTPRLNPRLVVRNVAEAIEFYQMAIGAQELQRFAEPSGRIVHAELQVGKDIFFLTEDDSGCNLSPQSLGGSPLLITMTVEDADSAGARMENAGAEVVIPIGDRYYGNREGRLRDPFGHLWIISQQLERLTHDEIHQRLTKFSC